MVSNLKIGALLLFVFLMNIGISNASTFVEVNSTNVPRNYPISGSKVFCVRAQSTAVWKIWASSYVEIKSSTVCQIKEDVSASSENSKSRLAFVFSVLVSNLRRFQDPSNSVCHSAIYVPLFKHYCFEVEAHGDVQINYEFTYVDVKLLSLFLIGLALFFFSKRISENELFHYFSGISIGVLGSVLILLIILIRFIPKKTTAIFAFATGTSLFIGIANWFYYNTKYAFESFRVYLLAYVAICALISWIYCFYKGPIRNPRAIMTIQYLLQISSLLFIYLGASYKAISVSIIVGFFVANYLSEFSFRSHFKFIDRWGNKLFPPTRKLLTQEEYAREAQEYTKKALMELREYCKSPECDKWNIIGRIKSPDRLSKFVQDPDSHVNEEEMSEYEKHSSSELELLDEE